ncbi:MAG: RNA methyltransferase [Verrucomicrobiota bacterium]|jgi:tRNA G18 (ribose-2'-O)-methylase SpoU
MFRIEKISSFDQPELAPYRTMRRSAEHEAQGIFVAEGEKVTRRLLESHFTVVSIVLPEKHLENYRPLLEARPEQATVYLAEKSLLESLTGFSLFQGVLAIGKTPRPASLEDILQKSPALKLFVAIDSLSNAENLGALVRNCVAFGVHGLIVGETSSSPFLRRSVRNSMGAIFQLPVWEVKMANAAAQSRRDDPPKFSLVQTLRDLRRRGILCIAAHPHASDKTISQADFSGDCCLVFGSEGYGISAPVLEACDEAVVIPMANEVDSLNVGAAAAVFLYEVKRQRGFVG